MKNLIIISIAALALSACGNKPVQPDWKVNASSSLKAYSDAYLKGDTSAAETDFTRARHEMASTGRPDVIAHAELYRCATRTASMQFDACPAFQALAQDATAVERTYAAYLDGQWQGIDIALLPEQHRAIVQAKAPVAGIADPFARLVAAGVLMKTSRITPADIIVATDTASAQGWRRPLLMWLGVSLKRAQAAGDSAEAARIERRIVIAAAGK